MAILGSSERPALERLLEIYSRHVLRASRYYRSKQDRPIWELVIAEPKVYEQHIRTPSRLQSQESGRLQVGESIQRQHLAS